MQFKRTEKVVAALVFVYSLVIYLFTVAPATSFWDSGEFIAIANRLQVSHPPRSSFFHARGQAVFDVRAARLHRSVGEPGVRPLKCPDGHAFAPDHRAAYS